MIKNFNTCIDKVQVKNWSERTNIHAEYFRFKSDKTP